MKVMKKLSTLSIYVILLANISFAQTAISDIISWKIYPNEIVSSESAKQIVAKDAHEVLVKKRAGEKVLIPKNLFSKIPNAFDWDDSNVVFKDLKEQTLPANIVKTMINQRVKFFIDTLANDSIEIIIRRAVTRKLTGKNPRANKRDHWISQWIGQPLPEFELKDLEGNLVTNEIGIGKIIVLNFWFTKCGWCVKEIDNLNRITKVFKDEPVVFLAPSYEGPETIENFLKKQNFEYRILCCARPFIDELNLTMYPTHMIVNEKGTILDIVVGGKQSIEEDLPKKLSWLVNHR